MERTKVAQRKNSFGRGCIVWYAYLQMVPKLTPLIKNLPCKKGKIFESLKKAFFKKFPYVTLLGYFFPNQAVNFCHRVSEGCTSSGC